MGLTMLEILISAGGGALGSFLAMRIEIAVLRTRLDAIEKRMDRQDDRVGTIQIAPPTLRWTDE